MYYTCNCVDGKPIRLLKMDALSFSPGFYISDNVYACMILRDASCQICHMTDCHRKSFHMSRHGLHLTADAYRVSRGESEHGNEIEVIKKEGKKKMCQTKVQVHGVRFPPVMRDPSPAAIAVGCTYISLSDRCNITNNLSLKVGNGHRVSDFVW